MFQMRFKISLFGKCFIWLFVLLSILSKDLHVKKIWTDTNIEIFLMKKLKTCSNHLLHVFIHNSLHMYCYQVLSSRVPFFFHSISTQTIDNIIESQYWLLFCEINSNKRFFIDRSNIIMVWRNLISSILNTKDNFKETRWRKNSCLTKYQMFTYEKTNFRKITVFKRNW